MTLFSVSMQLNWLVTHFFCARSNCTRAVTLLQ